MDRTNKNNSQLTFDNSPKFCLKCPSKWFTLELHRTTSKRKFYKQIGIQLIDTTGKIGKLKITTTEAVTQSFETI